jgi:hypothetical protein
MEQKNSPPIREFLPAALVLGVLGWLGIIAVLLFTSPNGGTRWAFFFFGMLAFTAAALPVMAFFNLRFPSNPPASVWIVARQAIWVGIFCLTLAWLQIGKVLTLPMALLLAASLLLVEILLRLRERSQWKP